MPFKYEKGVFSGYLHCANYKELLSLKKIEVS